MAGLTLKLVLDISLVLLVLITGFILHRAGTPYPSILFTVHKLATIALVIIVSLVITRFVRQYGCIRYLRVFILAGVISVAGLLISGAMLSLDKKHKIMVAVHRISTIVFVISVAGIFGLIKSF
jgi:hypothetical protein